MNQYVLDSSVGVKWIFDEEWSEKAVLLMRYFRDRKIQFIVPEFFYCELASASWQKVERKLTSVDLARDALQKFMVLPFVTYSDKELADMALDSALQYGVSPYDGLYLALAEINVVPLVTADRKLFDALKGRFDFIEFLGDVVLN